METLNKYGIFKIPISTIKNYKLVIYLPILSIEYFTSLTI